MCYVFLIEKSIYQIEWRHYTCYMYIHVFTFLFTRYMCTCIYMYKNKMLNKFTMYMYIIKKFNYIWQKYMYKNVPYLAEREAVDGSPIPPLFSASTLNS